MSSRIYKVTTKGKGGIEDTVLVNAVTGSAALRFVSQKAFEVKIASAVEVANLMGQGAKVVDSTKEEVNESAAST